MPQMAQGMGEGPTGPRYPLQHTLLFAAPFTAHPIQHCGQATSTAFGLTPRAKRNQFVQRIGMEEISIDL